MPPRSSREQSGFTLIEAVVAATLIATAVVVLAHLAAIGARQSAANRRALTSLATAQGKLEQLTAGVMAAGSGEQPGDVMLRWTVEPIEPSDPRTLMVQVCTYASGRVDQLPEACVATIRTNQP